MSPLAGSLLALPCAACAWKNNCTHLPIGRDDVNKLDLQMEYSFDIEPVLPTFSIPITDYCYLTLNPKGDGNYDLRREELTVCPPVKLEPFGFSPIDVTTPAGGDGPFHVTVVQYCRVI